MLVQCARVLHTKDFRLHVKLQKTCVHGNAHAIRVILNAGTVRTSIKFKSSCTVLACNFSYLQLFLPACYSCLWSYIMQLDSRVCVQCTRVLHVRDFRLRVN